MEPDDDDEMTAEDRRLRADGMAADGSRLNPGDILEDGSMWYPGWPDPPEDGVPVDDSDE